jgi:hypothetical protein
VLDAHRPEYLCSKIAETDFMVSLIPFGSTTGPLKKHALSLQQLGFEVLCRFVTFVFNCLLGAAHETLAATLMCAS